MKCLSKVVWSEGMYLGPHHFQLQNRYFEDLAHFVTSALSFEPYGFIGCSLDAEALQNGTASLLHARGVFPDGLVFDMPESDPVPPPRDITESFSPMAEHLLIQLAVAPFKPDGANCRLSEAEPLDSLRYSAVERPLLDENTGGDERRVRLGRKNIRLLFEGESAEGWVALPLARVVRDGSGHFIFDARFIPPCVQIAASDSLMARLRNLLGVLEERSATLPRAGRSAGKFAAGLSANEVAGFWFSHSINSAVAPLRHLYLSKRGHPEELFVELSRLAGALCTFGLDSHPRSLPLYDHLDLDKSFRGLEEHIRQHLDLIIPVSFVSIPLEPSAKYIYTGAIVDQRCLDRARWILSIHSEIGEADLMIRTSQLVKICSRQTVPVLVKRALPGLTLTHLPVPPSGISSRPDCQYFSISRGGSCWEHIVQERTVGVYVPGELPSPELELLVILEN
jgi:type VI secretion system protein ImpJ